MRPDEILKSNIDDAITTLNRINGDGKLDYADYEEMFDAISTITDGVDFSTDSPWHRVEEGLPPKATWVLTVATDGNVKLFNIATVDAGGQWWTCSPQNILRELCGVRYWMPIEPPKEEKHGN